MEKKENGGAKVRKGVFYTMLYLMIALGTTMIALAFKLF